FRYLLYEEVDEHPMTRMLSTHWLGNAGNFLMLLLVTSAESDLSLEEMSNRCNIKNVIPEMDIFSSPPNRTLREVDEHLMTRMLNTHWLGNAGNFFMLFLVTSAISNLSSEEMSNRCNSKTVIPEMDIFSSPPNRTLRVGADINLTCIAWPRNDHQLYPRKWTKYIQWYDPQGSPVGDKCLQSTPRVKELHCILMLKRLTMEQFGNYTCEAQNDYEGYCRQKVVEIELQGRQNV
ncbi:unnamed protein product, partial [Pocillopora meandrina]